MPFHVRNVFVPEQDDRLETPILYCRRSWPTGPPPFGPDVTTGSYFPFEAASFSPSARPKIWETTLQYPKEVRLAKIFVMTSQKCFKTFPYREYLLILRRLPSPPSSRAPSSPTASSTLLLLPPMLCCSPGLTLDHSTHSENTSLPTLLLWLRGNTHSL